MLSPSAAFNAEAVAIERRPVGRCNILFTDPFIGSGNSVVVNNTNPNVTSWENQLIDTKTSTPFKYLVLDGTCDIDGTFYLAPGTEAEALEYQFGWYSEEVSDGIGNFSTPPEAEITFGSARAIQFLRVIGEPLIAQYPTNFDLYITYGSPASEVLIGNYTPSSAITILDLTSEGITNATGMRIVINSWSHSNTVAKMVECFGVIEDIFGPDNIVSMNILEEVAPKSNNSPFGNVSCKTLSLSLQNISLLHSSGLIYDPFLPDNAASPFSSSIVPNVRLDPELGFKIPPALTPEYVSMGTFWSRSWDVSQSSDTSEIKAWCRMSILRENKFKADEVLVNYSLYDICEYVLNHAKSNIPMNDLEWSIDASLDGIIVPYTWFGEVSYMEALREIAEAGLGRAYFNREDVLIMESYLAFQSGTTPSQTIDGGLFFTQNRSINPGETKNYIKVRYNSLVPEDNAGTVKTVDASVSAGETSVSIEIEWGSEVIMPDDAEATITDEDGVTMYVDIANSVFYPWGAVVVAVKSSGTSGTFKVNVIAKKLDLVTVGEVVEYNQLDIDKNQKKEFEFPLNFLIQDEATAGVIAVAALETLINPRSEITVELPGNPAGEIGDIISIETYAKDSIFTEVRAIKQQFRLSQSALELELTGKETVDYGV